MCLFFNFWMINTLSSIIYKLRKLRNLSFWQNERRQKPDISHQSHESKLKNASNKSNTVQKLLSLTFLKPFSRVGLTYIIFTWTGHFNFQVYMIIILREIESSIGSDIASKIDTDITPIIIGVTVLLSACKSHNKSH